MSPRSSASSRLRPSEFLILSMKVSTSPMSVESMLTSLSPCCMPASLAGMPGRAASARTLKTMPSAEACGRAGTGRFSKSSSLSWRLRRSCRLSASASSCSSSSSPLAVLTDLPLSSSSWSPLLSPALSAMEPGMTPPMESGLTAWKKGKARFSISGLGAGFRAISSFCPSVSNTVSLTCAFLLKTYSVVISSTPFLKGLSLTAMMRCPGRSPASHSGLASVL